MFKKKKKHEVMKGQTPSCLTLTFFKVDFSLRKVRNPITSELG